ncbi:MAG: flagellar filament capping protein FliD [Rickettsiales bacterium]|jgi:flagellar hook-associated protein 2|nr:flagellar filament capping protein FliD [Rickettsiales bacterium]
MVTQIQLGNFFNSGGRTVVGGAGGSGLDTQSIIKSLTEAKRIPATNIEDRIELNKKRTAALTEYRTLLAKFKDALNFLRNPPGVANASDNVFRYVNTSVTSNTSVAGTTYLSATVAPGANIQNYSVTDITSVAKARKQTSANFSIATADTSVVSDSPTGVQFKAGTFTFKGKTITLAAGDSLNTVATKFNAVSSDTKMNASVVRVGDGSYQLLFTANSTGTAVDFDFNDGGTTLDDPDDVFDLVTINNQQAASNAVFKFNGTEITRQSNTITDLVSGLSLNIISTTPPEPDPTEININISSDSQVAKGGIINFINAYNDLKIFAAKQSEVNPDGTFAETAVLSNSAVMRSSLSNVASQLSSIIGGLGNGFNRLADIGIVSADLPESEDNPLVRNILNIDDAKLTSAISRNFDQVRRLFEFDFISNNQNLRVFSRTNALTANAFTLEVNPYATQQTKIYEIVDADTAVVSATPDTNQIKAGSVVINGIAIDLVAGDSLNQIRDKFNAVTASTGVTAEVVETAPNKFRLKFTSAINGVNTNLLSSSVNPNGVFTDAGITATPNYKATFAGSGGPVTVNLIGSFVQSSSGTPSGIRLEGPKGSAFEGLVLVYAGTTSSNIAVTATQGVADRIYNITDEVLKDDVGALEVEIDNIKTADEKLEQDIKRIDEQVERLRQELVAKFSALEQAISRVNTLLQSIDANQQALFNSN